MIRRLPSSGSGMPVRPAAPLVTGCQFKMTRRMISPKPTVASTRYGPDSFIAGTPTMPPNTALATAAANSASQKDSFRFSINRAAT